MKNLNIKLVQKELEKGLKDIRKSRERILSEISEFKKKCGKQKDLIAKLDKLIEELN